MLNNKNLEKQYNDSARVFIEDLQKVSESIRNEPRVTAALGIAYAGLNQKSKALDCANRTKELLKARPNAWLGPYAMEDVAFIYMKTGNFKEAFEILGNLLSEPGPLTLSLLEIDPRWKELREQSEYLQFKEK